MISDKLVNKYRQIYQHKFGKDISTKEAERELMDLKELVRLIVKERRARHAN